MFIKYNELQLFDFFESEPAVIGEYEAGDYIYSYQQNNFKIVLLISTYEIYIKISITYNNNIIYSQKHDNVLEIRKTDSGILRVLLGKEKTIIIKKEPQIGVIVE